MTPKGMNGHKLRLIADALDASDQLNVAVQRMAGLDVEQPGTEMQQDLRDWADQLDQAEYAMHEPAPAPAPQNVVDPKQAA